MLGTLLLVPLAKATPTKTWCIFSSVSDPKTESETSCKEKLTSLDSDNSKYTYEGVLSHSDANTYKDTTYTGDTAIVLLFSESLEINIEQLTFLTTGTTPTKTVVTYSCKLQIKGDYTIGSATPVPPFTSVFISGNLKSDITLSEDQIKKLGQTVTFSIDLPSLELTDQSTFPSIAFVSGKSLGKIELKSTLPNTVLKVDLPKLKYGSLEIDMSKSSSTIIKVPATTTISLVTIPTEAFPTPISLEGDPLVFDSTFTALTPKIFTAITAGAKIYVHFPETTYSFIDGTTLALTKITQYCASTSGTDKCSNSKDATMIKAAELESGVANSVSELYFVGEITLPTFTTLATFKQKLIKIDCSAAVSITQNVAAADTEPVLSLDLPNLKFAVTPSGGGGGGSAHILASESIQASGKNVNPMIVKNSGAITFVAATGLVLTGTETGNLDFKKASIGISSDEVPIKMYGDKNTILYGKDFIKFNNFEMKSADFKKLKMDVPGKSELIITKTSDATLKDTTIESEVASIHFDSSFNSEIKPFFTSNKADSLTTEFSGIPPWISSSTLTQVQPESKPSSNITPDPPKSGLPDWGIALIVIACVIVVAAIVVVVLQATGIIHICGKKKVEV